MERMDRMKKQKANQLFANILDLPIRLEAFGYDETAILEHIKIYCLIAMAFANNVKISATEISQSMLVCEVCIEPILTHLALIGYIKVDEGRITP
jgi:hypothetical protein